VAILGFIPSDQRNFGYNFVFGLALTIMNIAERNGGRSYATGLYFSKKADKVLGKERVERLRKFKQTVDPKELFNPNKVIGNGY
jgi:FAD/FMN-containing dehydrogenase